MHVQFSTPQHSPSQPLPAAQIANKGMRFETIRDNLLSLAKFEVGKWPFINQEKQLIEIEEGPDPNTIGHTARCIRNMKRKWYGAFDPNFVNDILKAALAIITQNKRSRHRDISNQAEELEQLVKPALNGLQCLITTYFNNDKATTSHKLDNIWASFMKQSEKEIKPENWNPELKKIKVEALVSESDIAAQASPEGDALAGQSQTVPCEAEIPSAAARTPPEQSVQIASSEIRHSAKSGNDADSSSDALSKEAKAKLSTEIRTVKAALKASALPSFEPQGPSTGRPLKAAAAAQPKINTVVANAKTDPASPEKKAYRCLERKPVSCAGKSPQDMLAEAMIKRRKAMLIDIEPDEPRQSKPAAPAAAASASAAVVSAPAAQAAPKAPPAKKYPEMTQEKIKQYQEANKKFQAEIAQKLKDRAFKKNGPQAEQVKEKPVEVKPVGKLSKIQCRFAQFFNLGMIARAQAEPSEDISSDWVDLSKSSTQDGAETQPAMINASQTVEEPAPSLVERTAKAPVRRATSELYDRTFMQGLINNMEAELDQTP